MFLSKTQTYVLQLRTHFGMSTMNLDLSTVYSGGLGVNLYANLEVGLAVSLGGVKDFNGPCDCIKTPTVIHQILPAKQLCFQYITSLTLIPNA